MIPDLFLIWQHWFRKNNIDLKGVKMIVEVPTMEQAHRFVEAFRHDIDPMYRFTTGSFAGHVVEIEIAGIHLELRCNQRIML